MPDGGRHPLPGWPAVLHESWAAAYLSLAPATFRKKIAPAIPPIQLTDKKKGWRKADLDAWVARQGEDGAALSLMNDWD